MNGFTQKFSTIKGLSDRRRMPLAGKIRLGIKVQNKSGVEYPKETNYFVCPPEVQAVFGNEPKELDIMLTHNDVPTVFPMSYVWYGQSRGAKCRGNGEIAERVNQETGELETRACPCEMLNNGCKQVARLLFMIPKVSVAGVYQIGTSSFNSIIDIQSGLEWVQGVVDRFAFVALKLRRIPTITHHDGKKQTHYTVKITLPDEMNIDMLAQIKADREKIYHQSNLQLPAPNEENPELDPPDVVDEEDQITPEDVKEEFGLPDTTPAGVVGGAEEDELDRLKTELQKAKNDDFESYLAGKRNAKISTKVPKTVEDAQNWLMEIEAYRAAKING
jgi:hypothetical protein